MPAYDLATLAKVRVATPLPPIEERLSTALSYRAALMRMLREIAREFREGIRPRYRDERARRAQLDALTVDDDPAGWFTRLRAIVERMVRRVSREVDTLLRGEAGRHSKAFRRAAKRALGVDLAAVVRDEDLSDMLRVASLRNAALIRSLGDDAVGRVQRAVLDGLVAGHGATRLAKELQRDFGVLRSRAELIASDQTAKLNADLNRFRQTQAGVTTYEWVSSRDERVRDRHRKLDGTRYRWGQRTGAEDGLPPGKPIRCRCIARGILTP